MGETVFFFFTRFFLLRAGPPFGRAFAPLLFPRAEYPHVLPFSLNAKNRSAVRARDAFRLCPRAFFPFAGPPLGGDI
jgi:hypothetical protein